MGCGDRGVTPLSQHGLGGEDLSYIEVPVSKERIEELQKRISEDPENLIDRFVLLSTYCEEKEWSEAVCEGREILERKPDYLAVYIHLGEALLRTGKREEARELLSKGKELAEKFGHLLPKEGIAKLLSELNGSSSDVA